MLLEKSPPVAAGVCDLVACALTCGMDSARPSRHHNNRERMLLPSWSTSKSSSPKKIWRDIPMPRQTNRLKRSQEIQNLLLLRRIQVVEELLLHSGRFATVAGVLLNRVDQVRGAPIVQQEDALSEPPQRCST